MTEIVVEIGMKLDKNLIYYHDLLTKNGFHLDYSCITHDIYYTNNNLEGLSENQMKNACIRLRNSNGINKEKQNEDDLLKKEQELVSEGYKKVFDTIKIDFQYCNSTMKSKIQIQDIKDIGLVVYYDNPDYYKYSEEEQRILLIKELNSYGFNLNEDDLGLDKLRTLYYQKEMYSINQNGK